MPMKADTYHTVQRFRISRVAFARLEAEAERRAEFTDKPPLGTIVDELIMAMLDPVPDEQLPPATPLQLRLRERERNGHQ